jgi:vacuolar-type H+-ATPase subunit E/Vma4
MAIEGILKRLEEQARADREAVLAQGREQARLVAEQGELEAQRIRDELDRKAQRAATLAAEKVVNAARLQAKMAVSSAKGAEVAEVFDEAARRSLEVRSQAAYAELFSALATEALAGIDGAVTIRVAAADEELASRAAKSAGVSATIDPTLSTAGGLVVEAWKGRVIRRNTLEERLARARQVLASDVAKVLFA